MTILTQWYEERGQLIAEARGILDAAANETDATRLTEAEQRHDAVMARLDALDARIQREERQAAAERAEEERRSRQRPIGRDGSAPGQDDAGDEQRSSEDRAAEYRNAFLDLARAGFNPQDIPAETRAVIKAGIAEFRAQSTSAAAGGYTVPTELAREIDKTLKMWGPMYDEDICTVINTASGNAIDFPTVDDTSVAVAKHTEGSPMTDDGGADVTFGKMTLNAFAYDTEWVQVSVELLQDSAVNIEAFIGGLLGERLARRVNTELTTGDGNGDPNGIVTASSLGKESASGTAITGDELIDLMHSVDPAYRMSPKARFMFNDSTLAAIRKLKDGQNNYLWQMGDVRVGAPGTLLGQPYSVNQAMASIGVGAKAVLYGDFSKYYVRKVGAPVIGVRREYYWPNIGLAGIVRLDGDLIQSGAVKHLLCNDGV